MRLKIGFAVLAVFALFLSGAVGAAVESGNATPSATLTPKMATASKENAKPEQTLPVTKATTEATEKKPEAAGVPVSAGDVCAIQATEQQAQIQALQSQIDALKQQLINNQTSGAQSGVSSGLPAGIPDLSIRSKNLPKGNYRERCFSCLTMPDEDGERVLMCTCPVGETGFERLSVNLTNCKGGQEIAYCSGMLVCGTCLINQGVGSEPETKAGDDLNELHKKSTGKKE